MKTRKPRHARRNRNRRRLFSRLAFEPVEARHLLANFTPGDVAALIADIGTANGNGEADTIDLGGGTFTLTAANNGSNGLPVIAADSGNALTIQNSTIARSTAGGTPQFRVLQVASGADLTITGSTIIGGNTLQGIRIAAAGSTGNLVQDNSIGFDGVTMDTFPNRDGVRIADDASGNTIGGSAAADEDNQIAHNTGRGVWISGGTGNTIAENSIHDNGVIGISLGAQGATPNDADTGSGADSDTGANGLQNFPVLASVTLADGNLEMTGHRPM